MLLGLCGCVGTGFGPLEIPCFFEGHFKLGLNGTLLSLVHTLNMLLSTFSFHFEPSFQFLQNNGNHTFGGSYVTIMLLYMSPFQSTFHNCDISPQIYL